MAEQPQIAHRDEQPYLAIATSVTMQGLAPAVDRYFPQLFGWLAAHGVEPAGPPFIRYLEIDMERELEIELGVPVSSATPVEDPVRAGVLPAGRWVTLLHVGPYDGLVAANARLQEWARREGIGWEMSEEGVWAGRAEHYLTDPSREPDPARWMTEVAYLSRGR